MPTFSNASPSKIYPNYDFLFENIPSGNPGVAMKAFYAQKCQQSLSMNIFCDD
jgi:hypothetical protein